MLYTYSQQALLAAVNAFTDSAAQEYTDYTTEDIAYLQIKDAAIYTVAGAATENPIATSVVNRMLFAMLQDKPVLLSAIPTFKENVPHFIKNLFSQRWSKIFVCSFTELDDNDLSQLLHSLAKEKVNYVLTKHEKVLIRAYFRNYFRHLLKSAS